MAQGGFTWENSLADGIWTYSLDEIHGGIVSAYSELKKDVLEKYGVKLSNLKALGISAMMHGYLAFDRENNLLVPFRTWRNTITGGASKKLTELFNYPCPERWSISHYYQAILNNEPHVPQVDFFTTLAGYAHFMLTGKKFWAWETRAECSRLTRRQATTTNQWPENSILLLREREVQKTSGASAKGDSSRNRCGKAHKGRRAVA